MIGHLDSVRSRAFTAHFKDGLAADDHHKHLALAFSFALKGTVGVGRSLRAENHIGNERGFSSRGARTLLEQPLPLLRRTTRIGRNRRQLCIEPIVEDDRIAEVGLRIDWYFLFGQRR